MTRTGQSELEAGNDDKNPLSITSQCHLGETNPSDHSTWTSYCMCSAINVILNYFHVQTGNCEAFREDLSIIVGIHITTDT